MSQIWKYPINPHKPDIETPKGALLLCAREQHDSVCVWAEVDPTQKTRETHHIEVYGTGHEFSDWGQGPRKYLGTAMLDGGSLVFHVFERT